MTRRENDRLDELIDKMVDGEDLTQKEQREYTLLSELWSLTGGSNEHSIFR